MSETIKQIEIGKLYPFPNNPFQMREIEDLAESITEVGIVVPIIARTRADGELEMLDGHRRQLAAQMAGIAKVPVIIKDLDDDAAAIVLVDSNIMRPSLLASERAFAYKLKLDALTHQGRTSGTECQKWSRDVITDDLAGRQVANYIRLTELIPDLLTSVDEGLVAIKPAVELSYLPKQVQKMVAEQMDINLCTPSHSQTRRLRAMHEQGQLSEKTIAAVMAEEKPNQVETIRLPVDRLKGYFPKSYTPKQIEDKLIEILEQWRKLERKRAARDSR